MESEIITLSSDEEKEKKSVKIRQTVKKKPKIKVLRKDEK